MSYKYACLTIGILASLTLATSCENDGYDTGDGALSYMRADFVEAYTNADALVEYVITDDDDRLTLDSPLEVSWMTEPNAAYRALLYYDMSDELIDPISISSVSTPTISLEADLDEKPTDPLYWNSSWISSNGRYINLGLTLLIGAEDGTIGTQTLGMMCTDVKYAADSTLTVCLTLLHDQCDVPEYYSYRHYLSIPISYMPCDVNDGDTVELTVNTYSGEETKAFAL